MSSVFGKLLSVFGKLSCDNWERFKDDCESLSSIPSARTPKSFNPRVTDETSSSDTTKELAPFVIKAVTVGRKMCTFCYPSITSNPCFRKEQQQTRHCWNKNLL